MKISDMNNFELSELDDLTLQELDEMSYSELISLVSAKHKIAAVKCNMSELLTSKQQEEVLEIFNSCKKNTHISLAQTLTVGVAVNIVSELLIWCTKKTVEHSDEIISALKQAYKLLEQFIDKVI